MSNEVAIRVENLSKAYRIGLKEQQHETMLGAVAAWVRAPFKNFREVRNLSSFGELKTREAMDIGTYGPKDSESQCPSVPVSQCPAAAESQSRSVPESQSPAPQASQRPSVLESQCPSDVFWALRDVSFEVKHGEAIGIIGRNGAGKSTLLKILSRITEPTSGRALIYGRVASLLEVGTGFHPDLTGRENVYLNGTILGMRKREIDAKFDEIVDFSGVEKFIDTPVKRYSSGMRVRLAFSVAAHLEPEILIVDEVLAVGDAEFQKRCLGKMEAVASQGRTVLFVSHNMEAVLTLCSRGVILESGAVSFIGDAPAAVHHYQRSGPVMRKDCPPHIVWQHSTSNGSASPCVEKIEVLDLDGHPKPMILTWDDVRFRVHYAVSDHVPSGSIILEIRDYRDNRLMVMDSGLQLPLAAGNHFIDCVVRRFPLAAGDYFLGAGLALANAGWLWRKENLGEIVVNGSDVFGIGRPPIHARMIFAVPQEWSSSNGDK